MARRVSAAGVLVERKPSTQTWKVSSAGVMHEFVTTNDETFGDDFESGTIANWTSSSTAGGTLTVNADAALKKSYGLAINVTANTGAYLVKKFYQEKRHRFRFYFDPNSLPETAGDYFVLWYAYDAFGNILARLHFGYNINYQAQLTVYDDAGTGTSSIWYTITDVPHWIEIDWKASSAPSANNGHLKFWLDGVLKSDQTGVDNDTRFVETIRIGAVSGVDTGTRGTFYIDEYRSNRTGNTIGSLEYLLPSGIASGEALGSPAVSQIIYPSGIASAEAFGEPTAEAEIGYLEILPSGIASAEAFGSPVLQATVTVAPSAIASAGAFGSPSLRDPVIARADHEEGDLSDYAGTVGSLSASAEVALAASGYGLRASASSSEFGILTCSSDIGVARARFYIDPNGIVIPTGQSMVVLSVIGEALSNLTVSLGYSNPTGYFIKASTWNDSSGAHDTSNYTISDGPHYVEVCVKRAQINNGSIRLWIDGDLKETISSIDNDARFGAISGAFFGTMSLPVGSSGTLVLDELILRDDDVEIGGKPTIHPSGLSTAEAFGSASVEPGSVTVSPSSISTAEQFGTALLQPGSVTIVPSGAASAETFGSPRLAQVLAPFHVETEEAFGVASLAPGAVTLSVSGITSTESFGTAAVIPGSVTISTESITSLEALGTPNVLKVLRPSGIASEEAWGSVLIYPHTHLDPSGIASAEQFGTPGLDFYKKYMYIDAEVDRVASHTAGVFRDVNQEAEATFLVVEMDKDVSIDVEVP